MKFTYDPEVDILMVYLDEVKPRRAGGAELPFGGAYADLAEDGTILAIEIMDASTKYPMEVLNQYPVDYEKPLGLVDAAAIAGTTPEALKKAVQRGRLRAQKLGRDWVTSVAALTEYLNSRAHTGPKEAPGVEASDNQVTFPRRTGGKPKMKIIRGAAAKDVKTGLINARGKQAGRKPDATTQKPAARSKKTLTRS